MSRMWIERDRLPRVASLHMRQAASMGNVGKLSPGDVWKWSDRTIPVVSEVDIIASHPVAMRAFLA